MEEKRETKRYRERVKPRLEEIKAWSRDGATVFAVKKTEVFINELKTVARKRKSDTIMAEFDEDKHPRDEAGGFTNGGAKEFRQNTAYEEIFQSKKDSYFEYYSKRLNLIVFERISTYKKFSIKRGMRFLV